MLKTERLFIPVNKIMNIAVPFCKTNDLKAKKL